MFLANIGSNITPLLIDFFSYLLLENQCNQEASTCDYAEALQDQYIIYTDKTINAFSDATCQAACTSETSFVCRSFTFR